MEFAGELSPSRACIGNLYRWCQTKHRDLPGAILNFPHHYTYQRTSQVSVRSALRTSSASGERRPTRDFLSRSRNSWSPICRQDCPSFTFAEYTGCFVSASTSKEIKVGKKKCLIKIICHEGTRYEVLMFLFFCRWNFFGTNLRLELSESRQSDCWFWTIDI